MKEVLVQALSLIAIIVLGQIIKRLGWLGREDFPKLTRLMLTVTLPAILITNFNTFHVEFTLLYIILIGFLSNKIHAGLGYFFSRKKGTSAQVFAILHNGSYNIGAFAMPYLNAFLGGTSLIYSSLFDIGNALSAGGTNYSWALGLAKGEKFTFKTFVRRMFRSPVFVTYCFLLLLQLFNLKLPAEVINFTSIVGAANTFLAMFVIGLGLDLKLGREKIGYAAKLLLQRYAAATLMLLATWFWLPAPAHVRQVISVLYFSPLAAMASGFAAETGSDIELSAFVNSVTIIVGIIVMPLIIILLPA